MLPFFESRSPELRSGGSTAEKSSAWTTRQSSRQAFGKLRRQLESTGAAAKNRFEYFRRMFRLRQVDWEFAAAQMICLCLSPGMVFDFAKFRKQTKDRWARDDPGFTMALMYVILLTSLAYSIALKTPLRNLLLAALFPVLVYLMSGVVAATVGFVTLTLMSQGGNQAFERPRVSGNLEFSNRLRQASTPSSGIITQLGVLADRGMGSQTATLPTVGPIPPPGGLGGDNVSARVGQRETWLRQQWPSTAVTVAERDEVEKNMSVAPESDRLQSDSSNWRYSRLYAGTQVEWTYCFDIHSNGVFCLVLLCGVLHYMLLPLLLHLVPNVLSTILSNLLFATALSYYFFVSSLGYSRLSIVPTSKAALFLYPAVVVVLGAVVLTLTNCNLTKLAIKLHMRLFCR